jgi:hypothetical protein
MPRGSTLGREFWRKHNVAYEGSGQSQPAYCALYGLNAKSFARWRTVFRRGGSAPPPREIKAPPRKPTDPGFIRLRVDDEVAQGDVSDPRNSRLRVFFAVSSRPRFARFMPAIALPHDLMCHWDRHGGFEDVP